MLSALTDLWRFMRARKRFWLAPLLYLAYLLGFVIAVAFVLHLRWVGPQQSKKPPFSLEGRAAWGKLPVELFHSLGTWDFDARRDSLNSAVRPKPPGLVRIGVVGDSFSSGVEVAPGLDYPSILGEMLRQDGMRAEVLNLASGWWGFHQAAYAWERMGKDLDLDYVLLGPSCFQFDRDSTFSHTLGYEPYYIHGRYVIEGEGLRWIDPAGAPTFEDRFAKYYGFFPAWRYIRFDLQAPAPLRALLPAGRELRNPFYYSPGMSEHEEINETYRRLLRRMTASGAKVVLLHYDPSISAVGHQADPRILAGSLEQQKRFPYWRLDHHSGAGNHLVAAAFRDAITGKSPRAKTLVFADLKDKRGAKEPAIQLEKHGQAQVLLGDQKVATLIRAQAYDGQKDAPIDLATERPSVIIALRPEAGSFLDSVLLLSPLHPPEGARLRLVVSGHGGEVSHDMGVPERLAAQLPLLAWTLPWLKVGSPQHFRTERMLAQISMLENLFGNTDPTATIRLMLGDSPLYDLRPADPGMLELVPTSGTQARFRPLFDTRVDLDRIGATGQAILQLDGERPVRVPVATWKSERYPITYVR